MSQPTQVLDVVQVLEEQNSLSVSGLSRTFSKQDRLYTLAKNEQQLQAMREQNEAKRLDIMSMLMKEQQD